MPRTLAGWINHYKHRRFAGTGRFAYVGITIQPAYPLIEKRTRKQGIAERAATKLELSGTGFIDQVAKEVEDYKLPVVAGHPMLGIQQHAKQRFHLPVLPNTLDIEAHVQAHSLMNVLKVLAVQFNTLPDGRRDLCRAVGHNEKWKSYAHQHVGINTSNNVQSRARRIVRGWMRQGRVAAQPLPPLWLIGSGAAFSWDGDPQIILEMEDPPGCYTCWNYEADAELPAGVAGQCKPHVIEILASHGHCQYSARLFLFVPRSSMLYYAASLPSGSIV